MFKFISQKNRLFLRNLLIILHILFAAIGFYLYLSNYYFSENILIQKSLTKELILAKSGSSGVENLFKSVQNELSSLIFSFVKESGNSPIDLNVTRVEFAAYIQRSQPPINGIAMYDEKGKMVILENREHIREGEGQSFSQTAYIKWSQEPTNRNKIYISTPYIGTTGSSKGKIIILVVMPIYIGDTFRGTLAVKIKINDFRTAFITPLSSDGAEDSFVLNTKGVYLAGKDSLLNLDLFAYARQKNWGKSSDFRKKLQGALNTHTTQTEWVFQSPGENPKDLLVGISLIDIPNSDQDLYLVVTSTKDNVLSSLKPLRKFGYAWLGFGLLTTIISSIIVIYLQST